MPEGLSVLANQLNQFATGFAEHLTAVTGKTVSCQHFPAEDAFITIYQKPLPSGSGVYWFSLLNGKVFYIGKADSFTSRIWKHTFAAKCLEDGKFGFPNCDFSTYSQLSADEQKSIRRGEFKIDYLRVEPPKLASSFEGYLHTMCELNGGLPPCNRQIG
jgi:hypothetical protein